MNQNSLDNAARPFILFDPVCGSLNGHNFPTLIKYANWIAQEFNVRPQIWVPGGDSQFASEDHIIEKRLPWIYEYYLPTSRFGFNSILGKMLRSTKDSKWINRLLPSKAVKILLSPLAIILHFLSIYRIKRSIKKILKLDPEFIFMPGADFYTIISLEQLEKQGQIPRNISIILRLMGVMETAAYIPGARDIYIHSLNILSTKNPMIKFSCETEKYARYISKMTRLAIPVTPIPLNSITNAKADHSQENILFSGDRLNVVCLGGARADKGYFELNDLINYVRRKIKTRVHFIVQSMGHANKEFDADYQLKLLKNPAVTLLPHYIREVDMLSYLERCDTVLLPYSQATYEYRGSAILFDTLPFGKILVGRRKTGFGDTIDSNGLGYTFENESDLKSTLEKIIELNDYGKTEIAGSQMRYLNLMSLNLRKIFDEEINMRIY
jgi:hypothetical protein